MKNFLFTILFTLTSLFSFGQTDVSLLLLDNITETYVSLPTSNTGLKVTFDISYDAVLFNEQNLLENGSVFPITGGYFTVPFANGDVDTLIFVAGGGVYVDTLYLTSTLNTNENYKMDFSVYPNPTTDFLHLNIENYSGSFDVYDMAGKLLIQTTEKTIDMRSLSPGSYILHAGERVQKVIVE